MTGIMARSLKLNYYGNISRVYILKIHLEHNSCGGCCVIFKKVPNKVCVEACEPSEFFWPKPLSY
jgi:hypothetical protein